MQVAALGGETVARVGTDSLPGGLVQAVASRRGISKQEALTLLVDDALVAGGAREAGLDRSPAVSAQLDAALARVVITRAQSAALAAGPPTDAEVDALTRTHWRDFDLPEQLKAIHAVVVRPKPADPTREKAAKAIAAELAAREVGSTDAADFEARANAVPHEGFELKVETLEPFVADGRIVTSPTTYDQTFAASAAALGQPGTPAATSGVVETTFGWHVIHLLERLPGKHVPLEERRAAFAEEAVTVRANTAMATLVGKLRQDMAVQPVNGAEDLMTEAFAASQRTSSDPR